MQLLEQLEKDPFIMYVLYASNATTVKLDPQDSNLYNCCKHLAM